jgi:radical SAM protein with 4Fe4S-binding SPASM domain
MNEQAYQLKSINWEWTLESDEDSLHGPPADGQEDLTTEQMMKVVDDLGALGCEMASIGGGNIFLRSDWEKIAKAMLDKGIKMALMSSGEGIRENIAKIPQYFKGVGITIEGTAGTHDTIKQKSGSFERAVDAIKALKDAGVYTGVVTTISNMNITEMETMYSLVKELAPKDWLVRTTMSSGALRRPGFESYTIPPADLIILIKYISDYNRHKELTVAAGCDIGYYAEEEYLRREPWRGCISGIWTAALESCGNVKPCLCLPDEFIEGNVKETSLSSIWSSADSFSSSRHFNPEYMSGYCRVCQNSYTCGCGCIGSAFASTGSRYDNIYCFECLTKEFRFMAEHPEGGKTLQSLTERSKTAKEELFTIYRELADRKNKEEA